MFMHNERELLLNKNLEAVELAFGSKVIKCGKQVQYLLEGVLQVFIDIVGDEEEVEYEVDDELRNALLHCSRWN